MHRIYESADARRFGVASVFDFHPDVGARVAKKLVSHRQISGNCLDVHLQAFRRAVFDPIQF